MSKTDKVLIYSTAGVILAPILFYVVAFFLCDPYLIGNHEDIDISSGRIRHRKFLFYLPYGERIEDSIITKALHQESLAQATPDWRPVNIDTPGVRICSSFHFAFVQLRKVKMAWEVARFGPEAKQEVAKVVLSLWQQAKNDSGADKYIQAIVDLSFNRRGQHVALDDLPKP